MAASNTKEKRLFLRVYTRRGTVFDGEVVSITSFNDTGKFDVLREHTHFISIVKDRIIVRQVNGPEQQIPVGDAIMRVKDENVEVFLGVRTK